MCSLMSATEPTAPVLSERLAPALCGWSCECAASSIRCPAWWVFSLAQSVASSTFSPIVWPTLVAVSLILSPASSTLSLNVSAMMVSFDGRGGCAGSGGEAAGR